MVPELDDFPSHDLGVGRVFDVAPDVRCVAYWIADGETLPFAGSGGGFIVYAFMYRHRISVWNMAVTPQVLRDAMEAARCGFDPDAERPAARAPGGEPAMIQPQFSRTIEQRLTPRPYDLHED